MICVGEIDCQWKSMKRRKVPDTACTGGLEKLETEAVLRLQVLVVQYGAGNLHWSQGAKAKRRMCAERPCILNVHAVAHAY